MSLNKAGKIVKIIILPTISLSVIDFGLYYAPVIGLKVLLILSIILLLFNKKF
jgi:hypothetical protein